MTLDAKETVPERYEIPEAGVVVCEQIPPYLPRVILIGFSGNEYLFVPGVGFVDKIRETRH